ncbi:MAG: antibiotic biosynthesis monooxygenase [Gammaproteobacteria bacterium]|nr:antibiotic biosynthesis monooxygenase [Gammaproteobacteria bacterium]
MLARSPSHVQQALRFALAILWPIGVVASAEVRAESAWTLTFIEVRVDARGHAGNVLRQQAKDLREHTSWPAQIVLLQELSRPERFVLLQREEPEVSAGGGRERQPVAELLTDELTAPPDRRRNRGFDEVAAAVDAKNDVRANVYVVAHLGVGVPDRARTEAALRQLAAAARQSAGNVRFDIWQQTDRTNHFNVISGWISESQFYAFAASHAARDFRQTVGPLLGPPYDERLFRRVD